MYGSPYYLHDIAVVQLLLVYHRCHAPNIISGCTTIQVHLKVRIISGPHFRRGCHMRAMHIVTAQYWTWIQQHASTRTILLSYCIQYWRNNYPNFWDRNIVRGVCEAGQVYHHSPFWKRHSGMLGSISDLKMSVWHSDPGGKNPVRLTANTAV